MCVFLAVSDSARGVFHLQFAKHPIKIVPPAGSIRPEGLSRNIQVTSLGVFAGIELCTVHTTYAFSLCQLVAEVSYFGMAWREASACG